MRRAREALRRAHPRPPHRCGAQGLPRAAWRSCSLALWRPVPADRLERAAQRTARHILQQLGRTPPSTHALPRRVAPRPRAGPRGRAPWSVADFALARVPCHRAPPRVGELVSSTVWASPRMTMWSIRVCTTARWSGLATGGVVGQQHRAPAARSQCSAVVPTPSSSIRQPALSGSRGTKSARRAVGSSTSRSPRVSPRWSVQTTDWLSHTASR
jgi:hypothetical protein